MGQKKTVITCLRANHSGAPYTRFTPAIGLHRGRYYEKKSQAHQVQIFIETRAY
jgi:hypothetical protein